MKARHALMLVLSTLLVALLGYAYLHSRAASPLQDPSSQGTGSLEIARANATTA
ncbi:hypothetical protein [Lysobacter panacisoli]|uniref:Uncharacterized protein n=1 Tax=Lysobacter panacisoli TaxID=1255263 RepID=A0ABP9LP63_9GAMM|nr:hypothetical protein [Lysobacter panacisoli]